MLNMKECTPMLRSRASNVIRRVTTAGPYVDERVSILVLTLLVALGPLAVAYAEKSVPSFLFAPLYILPLALSALVHPLRVSLVLAAICLSLHDLLGPAPVFSIQHVTKDVFTLFGFFFVVIIVNQLGTQRKRLAELAKWERDDLAREIRLAAEVQQSILPRSIPSVPGFEFGARMHPAKIVAGDYYGFIALPQEEIRPLERAHTCRLESSARMWHPPEEPQSPNTRDSALPACLRKRRYRTFSIIPIFSSRTGCVWNAKWRPSGETSN